MRVRMALAFALMTVLSGIAFGQALSLSGPASATMKRGDSQTFVVTIKAVGQWSDALDIFIGGSAGLTLAVTSVKPAVVQCSPTTRDGKNFVTCSGSTFSLPTGTSVDVAVKVTVLSSASTDQSWNFELVGWGLSGVKPLVSLITVTDHAPRIVVSNWILNWVAVPTGSTLAAGAYLAVVLQNRGDVTGSATLSITDGTDIFSVGSGQSSVNRVLTPGAEVTIPISTPTLSKGTYFGGAAVSGDVAGGVIRLPLGLSVADRPTATPKPSTNSGRIDVPTVMGENANTSVGITLSNNGDGTVNGLLGSDVAWLIPPKTAVTIPPGETKTYSVTLDPLARPASSDSGSLVGTVSLDYLLPSQGKSSQKASPLDSRPGTGSLGITIVSTVTPGATTTAPPPLNGNNALFVPGVGHVQGSVGLFISDLNVFPKAAYGTSTRSISNVDLYFTPLATPTSGAKKFTVNAVSPPSSAAFGDLVSTVFGTGQQVGTLQLRSPAFTSSGTVGLNANVFNVSNKSGTYGTTLPVFSDYTAVRGTDKEFLTGLRKDASSHTNVYLQEASGNDITAGIDFFDASGNKIGSTTSAVPAFGAVQLGGNTVPNGTVSAALSVVSGSGSLHGYATPVDEASGDTWIVVDWSRIYGYYPQTNFGLYTNGANLVIPVAGAAHGANNTYFKTDVAIMNVGSVPSTGTLRYYMRGGGTVEKTISLNPMQTQVHGDITTNFFGVTTDSVGFLTYTFTTGVVAITSRNYTTSPGTAATYGTHVPTLPTATPYKFGTLTGFGISKGNTQRIAGIEDAAISTVGSARGGTFRSNFGLVEVSGQAATVRVTVYYNTGTNLTASTEGGSATYQLPANGFILTGNIANAVLGADRARLGDLHNVTVEFTVLDGDGRVVPFISSVDNGSGDSTFRVE